MQWDDSSQGGGTGRLVGRYMVHRRIAAGGMATVHLGRLLGAAGFSRTVAIKRLHDGYAQDPEFVAMLLDEARLASTIRHPNVVPTLDVVAEQNELLVVMDYVQGDSLAHLSKLAFERGQRVPPGIAAAVVAQALHGLHAAHEATDKNGVPLGIVHRDVSPQNVLVGVDGVARVLDFGIAKARSRATSTEDGQLKGKTAYMAPEQLQKASVDRRTDVFAASIMLWELLTGRRLFFGDSPAETIANVLHAPIDSPQRHAPELPAELAIIVLRGLERDPEARFATAEEMALAVEDAIALPRAKEIGAWVSDVARDTVEARAELVREIERESLPMQASSDTDPELRRAMLEADRRRQMADQPTSVGRGAGGAPPIDAWSVSPSARREGFVVGQPPPHTGRGPVEAELTDLAATVRSDPNLRLPEQRSKVSRLSLVLGVLGGLATIGAVVVVIFVLKMRVAPAADPPTAAPVATPVASPASTPAAVTDAGELDPVASVAVPAAKPSTTATTTARRGSVAKPPPARPAAGDCTIPYTLDAQGNKHFKESCFK